MAIRRFREGVEYIEQNHFHLNFIKILEIQFDFKYYLINHLNYRTIAHICIFVEINQMENNATYSKNA